MAAALPLSAVREIEQSARAAMLVPWLWSSTTAQQSQASLIAQGLIRMRGRSIAAGQMDESEFAFCVKRTRSDSPPFSKSGRREKSRRAFAGGTPGTRRTVRLVDTQNCQVMAS